MRRLWAVFMLLCVSVTIAEAQETRGNINGTVHDATGVIPGATVSVTNVDTGQVQRLVTNGSGYFEAPLLQPGQYRVTVAMPNFKELTQSGITLSVGQSLTLKLSMEIGQVTERVDVTARAPLLDTTSVSSGQTYDQALISGLPMATNMPILLARFAQGVVSPTTQVQVISGQIDGPTNAAGSVLGGVGSFNYTIDGATNAGSGRRIASSPNADMIQEMRVETSNFDAAQGHGTGSSIAMITRAGSNLLRGTGTYQYWSNKINSLNPQQKLAFAQRPETGQIYEGGYMNNGAITVGGPVVIPKIVNGRNKLFFFGNYQRNYDNAPAQSTPTSTVPANAKHLDGDFSDLLALPNGSVYQIYDPLSVRPDPARPGSFIRTAFPNNIIPKDRFMNPDGTYKNSLFALYRDMAPTPNQNFVESGQVPQNNYYQGGIPNQVTAQNFGIRIDYNHSENDRFFFRASGTTFYEYNVDWTYETKYAGLHSNDKTRASWSYTGNWTRVLGSAVIIDTQVAANHFYEDQQRRGLHQYKPTDVGLPSYLDEFCQARNNCMLPSINVAGYQGVSNNADGGLDTTNLQIQSTVSQVRGTHTLRGGIDFRLAMRRGGLMAAGNVSSSYNFDTTYTRAADTTTAFPTTNIGPSLAALMLGIPTSVSIGENAPISMRNPYYGVFFQDTWRASPNLTLNFGLRFEYEEGIREKEDRWLTEFDPDARLTITDLAQAAYARNPIPQVPVDQFRVLGGSVYASDPGASGLSWTGEAMWMPRISSAYKLGDRTVIKSGYGLFFDTLNAGDYGGFNQFGYSSTTTNVSSTDFGRTWLLGDPANGVSPLADPFPVRPGGGRFEIPLEDSLGVDSILGTAFTREDPNRKHPRVQRWRVGVQREVLQGLAVEVAYAGSYADRVARGINEVYVPEQYYSNVTDVRDASAQAVMQQQVVNPFHISNFASLATTNPVLYARMLGNAFFNAQNVQRQTLLRGFPHLTGLTYNLPLGVVKSHALEISVDRRYSKGLSANLAFAARRVTENRTVEAYDREPTMWQTSQNARPWRLSGSAVYELPFGRSRPFLNGGGVAAQILGGWQTGATFEYQPGALLEWGNLFFNGDPKDIVKDKPEVALQRDGTIDLTKTWFNIDAGFERDLNRQPAAFQKRSFPFRVDGVRGTPMFLVNANIQRNFDLGGRRVFQVRMDVQNLFDAVQWGNPDLNPTSTNFGRITTATNSIMRFFTFMGRFSF